MLFVRCLWPRTAVFEAIYQSGYKYKKAGVIVTDIVSQDEVQQSLFDLVDRTKEHSLMQALDGINLRFGQSAIKLAVQGIGDRPWKLKQAKLSPCYTTRWDDIIKVKV
jgi:DNA polymerase V